MPRTPELSWTPTRLGVCAGSPVGLSRAGVPGLSSGMSIQLSRILHCCLVTSGELFGLAELLLGWKMGTPPPPSRNRPLEDQMESLRAVSSIVITS